MRRADVARKVMIGGKVRDRDGETLNKKVTVKTKVPPWSSDSTGAPVMAPFTTTDLAGALTADDYKAYLNGGLHAFNGGHYDRSGDKYLKAPPVDPTASPVT